MRKSRAFTLKSFPKPVGRTTQPKQMLLAWKKCFSGSQPTRWLPTASLWERKSRNVWRDGNSLGSPRRGVEAEVTTRKVRRVNLYTASADGTIDCRDAESGEPIWINQIGQRNLLFGTMGIGDEFLTITNGGNLIKLDVRNGAEINVSGTTGTPLFGSIQTDRFAVVATLRNGVEGYPLVDTTMDPFSEMVAGLATAPPTKAPGSSDIAWATNQGFVYAMELSGAPSVQFRLDHRRRRQRRIGECRGQAIFLRYRCGTRLCGAGDATWRCDVVQAARRTSLPHAVPG